MVILEIFINLDKAKKYNQQQLEVGGRKMGEG